MLRYRYVVTGEGAARGYLFDRTVAEGQELWLTEGEATTPLEQGLIENGSEPLPAPETVTVQGADIQADRIVFSKPQNMGKSDIGLLPTIGNAVRHPLDHDGDGRKGGSLKGSHRRRS